MTTLSRALGAIMRTASISVPLVVGTAITVHAGESRRLTADIPSQPLAQALEALADQTGLQIVYVSGVVRDQRSRRVSAGTGVSQALSRMLQGTGLNFEFLTSSSIRILAEPASVRPIGATLEEPPDEIIVTANRRSEALQNVPITVQVLSGAMLSNLGAISLEDYLMYLPGVTAHGVGPSQNSLYIRGLGTSEAGNQVSGSNGIFPNVAVYLDDQSAQLTGRNLDIYAADLDRIEVLEGPQGTLFGAGAEAGVIRYITNKPKINVTEGSVEAGYAITAHGDPSSSAVGVINLPLIRDLLAVRGVIYNDRRGGYIDNIPATFARLGTDPSIRYANYFPGEVPPNSVVINNDPLVASNINPLLYQGIRVQALYQMNEAWSVLLSQSYQSMEADGVFAETAADSVGAPLPPLTTQLFNPSYDRDRFENTAVTVNGRWGGIDWVYAGAYLVRNIEQVQDYTNYARGGASVDYYQCVNPGPTPVTAQCFTPSSTWRDVERNVHQSHEIRLSTPPERRLRALGGLFYENYRVHNQDDWFYLTALPYFNPIGPPQGYYLLNGQVVPGGEAYGTNAQFVPGHVTSNNPNVRPLGDAFFNDTINGYSQKAIFGSVDGDLIPQVLTLAAGTRYFQDDSSSVGSDVGSYGCSRLDPTAPNPCLNRQSTDLDALGLRRRYKGFRSRASLSWKPAEDAMVYFAWSQGFRAGGFNRGFPNSVFSPYYPGTAPYQSQAAHNGGWAPPLAYAPDELTNIELGWRSSWASGDLVWNGTLYQENWVRAQVGAQTTSGAGGIVNGGTYRVRGLETSVQWRIVDGLSVNASAVLSGGQLIKEGAFYWANGVPIDFTTLRDADNNPVPNPAGQKGSSLSGAPAFQGNVLARYEMNLNSLRLTLQANASHQSHSLSSTTVFSIDAQHRASTYDLPGFSTFGAGVGAEKNGWKALVYVDNLTDVRATLFANYYNFVKAVTINRPRTLGLHLSRKFGGS